MQEQNSNPWIEGSPLVMKELYYEVENNMIKTFCNVPSPYVGYTKPNKAPPRC